MRILASSIFAAVALALGLSLMPAHAATMDGPLSISATACAVTVAYVDDPAVVVTAGLAVTVNGVVTHSVAPGGLDTGPGNDDSVSFALAVAHGDTVAATIGSDHAVSLVADCPAPTGSITVELDVRGIDNARLGFRLDRDAFSLRDGQSRTFDGLEDDEYTVRFTEPGYNVTDIECRGIVSRRIVRGADRVTIDLDGEDVRCVFDVERERATPAPTATSTPAPTATPVPTQAPVQPAQPIIVNVTLPTPQPSAPAPQPSFPVIQPPSTGDGGLLP